MISKIRTFINKIFIWFPAYVLVTILVHFALQRKVGAASKYRDISFAISIVPFKFGQLLRYMFYKKTLKKIGENVNFMFGCVVEGNSCEIGDNVYIGPFAYIYDNITIGNNVMIAPKAVIMDGRNHHRYCSNGKPFCEQAGISKKTTIGNNVWIGINACITSDVSDNCVIGASAIVLKPTNVNEVLAGNPARLIKKII